MERMRKILQVPKIVIDSAMEKIDQYLAKKLELQK